MFVHNFFVDVQKVIKLFFTFVQLDSLLQLFFRIEGFFPLFVNFNTNEIVS